jgi:hypothetical protein
MRSHLTRNVFKRLLSNEALIFRCPHRSEDAIYQRYAALRVLRLSARRTLFGFSAKPPRQIRDNDIDPGFGKMLDLTMTIEIQARPPPATELVRAFNTFFSHKSKRKEAVNNIQAQNALGTFRYLQHTNTNEPGFGLSLSDLQIARDCMTNMPADQLHIHNIFSWELFAEISRRKRGAYGDGEAGIVGDIVQLIKVLTLTGDSMEARKLVEGFWKSSPEAEKVENPGRMKAKLWNLVLRGFAKEQNETELTNTARIAEDSGVLYNPTFHEIMTTFYATKDDIEGTKAWYTKKIDKSHKPNARTMLEVLRVCLRKNEVDWCNSVFRTLLESNPTKLTWDVIFQWAVGALGKGVEDVEHMMEVMVRRNAEDDSVRPDTETINGLVEFAISRNDPYLAERYLTLGSKMGIRPNAKTFILQMDYRVDAGDLSGAQAAYDALQGEEVVDQEDLPVINKYIRALCFGNSPNYDRITSIVADLDDRKARPEADTVSALCLMYLKRGELEDATDILRAHTFHYTLDERASIRDTFLAFCLDRSNTTTSAWDVYQILREMFDETDVKMRTQLMNEFFDRKRCDMACYVFGHMRQHIRPDMRPTAETYVQCFEGIAKCEDMESLDMVHNMMKMDSSIEPSTKLYNALMLAYTAGRDSDRALDLWTDITNSIEGPTYNSLQIVFRACEVKPFGHKTAKEIWNKMRRMEIEVTPEVFSAYVGALAGSGLFDEAKTLIEGMETDVGFGPDVMT